MLREQIKKDVEKAVSKLVSGKVGPWDGKVEVTRTNDSKFGDFTTNLPLKIKHENEHSPMKFAKVLADSLKKQL